MVLNRHLGKWWDEETYSDHYKPNELDDVAYHFYVTEIGSYKSSPQPTVIYNYRSTKHKSFLPYYKKAERYLKIKKLKNL